LSRWTRAQRLSRHRRCAKETDFCRLRAFEQVEDMSEVLNRINETGSEAE